ncbi:MAG TPA: hypothetical protein VL988_00960 [Solirubrobacteraceae bacterium]|nr:hypothetical protein [Solirubrobacteraceae bacterium]
MARSIAATTGGVRRAPRQGAVRARPRRARSRLPVEPALPRALALPATALARAWRAGWRRPRMRIAMAVTVAAIPILGGGWLWLRQSPFVSVQRVRITGVSGPDAQAVRSALTDAARAMSTLDVDEAALRAAVAPLHVVRSVRVVPSPPHGLRIEVSEQLPVAALSVDGMRTAVAGDGVALGASFLSRSLPTVSGYRVPAPGRSVHGPRLRAELAVLGAAPALLARHVERVFTGAKGLTVAMRNGLLVYFGDGGEALAKWLSLARVLSDPGSAGASYVDVRLPTHPAAGFPAGVTPPQAGAEADAGASSGEGVGSSEDTVAALAEAMSGGDSAAGTEPQPGAASETASATPSTTSGETGAGGAGEAQPGSAEAPDGVAEGASQGEPQGAVAAAPEG